MSLTILNRNEIYYSNYQLFYNNSNLFKRKYPKYINEIKIEKYSFKNEYFLYFINFLNDNDELFNNNIINIIELCNFWECFQLLKIIKKRLFETKENPISQLGIGFLY